MNLNGKRMVIVHFVIGVVLVIIADRLNKLGIVDWGTVFISAAGIALVLVSIVDFLKRKK